MDWILALGGLILMLVGFVGMLRPDLLWRLYSLEPRWHKEHPEQPQNWHAQAKKQGYIFIASGVIFILLAFVLVI